MDFSISQSLDVDDDQDYNPVPKMTIWPTTASSPFEVRALTFDTGPILIGRTNGLFKLGDDLHPTGTNAIFSAATVSRRHAQLSFNDGNFWIEDLKSSHGTLINGDRLRSGPYMLMNSDIVTVGTCGSYNGIDYKPVEMKVTLHFPTDLPASGEQYSSQEEKHKVECCRNKEEEEAVGTEMIGETQSMDGLISELQSKSNCPDAKRKLDGVLEAKFYKKKFGLSNQAAVALVPELAEFPPE